MENLTFAKDCRTLGVCAVLIVLPIIIIIGLAPKVVAHTVVVTVHVTAGNVYLNVFVTAERVHELAILVCVYNIINI